jgi:hypothetical protein
MRESILKKTGVVTETLCENFWKVSLFNKRKSTSLFISKDFMTNLWKDSNNKNKSAVTVQTDTFCSKTPLNLLC